MSLIAKPVIDKQFWILQEGDRKIGNIEACAGGYQVKINNQIAQFKTIKMAAERVNIQFETAKKTSKPVAAHSVYGYPTKGRVHNGIWNVPKKLPLFTKTKKSKSWYAAGWYQVKKGKHWSVVQDPKLILLQRYPYAGPFYTKENADEHASTTVC
jgi:hypothetical protein